MADYIVNITQDTQTEIPKGLPSAVSQELQSAGSSSPSSTAVDISTSLSVPNRVAHRWYLKESETESSLKEQTLVLEKEQLPPITTNSAKVPTKWHIPLPSDHVKGAIYDVVLGVSTQNLSIDSIESILFTFEQTRNGESDFIYESEVIKSHELKRLCSKDGTVKEEESGTQGSDADKEEKEESAAQGSDTDEVTQVFQWKLFTQCYGIGDGLTITMDITMWSDRSPDYGSLDLHFVELCHDSSALYRAESIVRMRLG
ncbi:hypothetical protein BGX23_003865 [Mortierella sp. AD031]|nr:hypothetical protein BGX23_003865 [Mortierella sp. AD031]